MYERRNSRRRQILVSLTCLLILGYFADHALNGRHGLAARTALIERSELLEQEIGRLEAVRARLEREVRLLGANPPDPDLVAEIASAMLGLVPPDAVIVIGPLKPR